MRDEEIRLLERFETDHWWFVGKRMILDVLLGEPSSSGRLLDLGCGTGGFLRHLGGGLQCVGMDRSALALRVGREHGLGALVRGDLGAPPFRAGAFSTIVLSDVIEHVDDDVGALRVAARLAAPGSRLVITVPAFQFLWSRHDETFEHRRRYSARQLLQVVRAAGLVPERTTYTNFFAFPIAAVWRPLSYRLRRGSAAAGHDFSVLPRWLNAVIIAVYRFEAALLKRMDLPVGVSVVCTARPASKCGTGS